MSEGTPLEIAGGVVGKPVVEFGLISPELMQEFVSGDLDDASIGRGVDVESAVIVDAVVSTGSLAGGSDGHNVHAESGLIGIQAPKAIRVLGLHYILWSNGGRQTRALHIERPMAFRLTLCQAIPLHRVIRIISFWRSFGPMVLSHRVGVFVPSLPVYGLTFGLLL